MTAPDRGTKYLCPDCGSKYYDMGKAVVTCPKCGAKPSTKRALRSVPGAKPKASHMKFNRYPS